jgi:hypothetical protein
MHLYRGIMKYIPYLIVLTEIKALIKNGSVKGKKIIRQIDQATTVQDFKYRLGFET